MGNSISVSVIAPTAYLNDFVAQSPPTVHHVAAQNILNDPLYRAFFLKESKMGATIIVDNGVFDLGEALPAPDLFRAARAVRAKEIILPDVIGDGPATMKASDQAAIDLVEMGSDMRLCVVVQGADDNDWLRCYDHFASSSYVGAIALPASRRKSATGGVSSSRIAATRHLEDNGLINSQVIYRLLGLGLTGHLELHEQRHHEWIDSVDCVAPVVLGSMGVAMLPDGPFEKISTPRIENVGYIPLSRFPLIRENIAAVRYAANCPIALGWTA